MSTTGHKFVEQSTRNAELQKLFKGHPGAIQVEPGSWVMPKSFQKYAADLAKFEFEETDVLVNTMPKSGTTWTQEIVWTMKNNPNMDHPMAHLPLNLRTPILELDILVDHKDKPGTFVALFEQQYPDFDQSHGMFIHFCKMAERPRTIKTHLSTVFLSPTALSKSKVVYVIRDPRDVCISLHHHSRIFKYENYTGTFDQYVETFIAGAMWLGPYWEHVKQAWKLRDHPNFYIMFYEKLRKNTKEEFTKLSRFLGINLTEKQLDDIIHYTSFAEMKKRDNHVVAEADAPNSMNLAMVQNEGGFFRQGTSGGWKKVLTQEQKEKFQVWIDENCPDKEIMNTILNP